jgi:hypothetical protein
MPNNMPERIWAFLMPGGGKSKLRFWKPRPLKQYGGEDAEYVRADIAEAEKRAAVAREREACAQIAKKVADRHIPLMPDDRLPDGLGAHHRSSRHAANQIADEISNRDTAT